MRRGVLTLLVVLACVLPVAAEEAQWCPATPEQTAQIVGQAARVPGLEKERDDLKVERDGLKAQVTRMERLTKLDEAIEARIERLTKLADEEAAIERGRADRIAKDASKGVLWLRVQARAGAGALIGAAAAPAFPPAILIGPAVGALVGLVEHWLSD